MLSRLSPNHVVLALAVLAGCAVGTDSDTVVGGPLHGDDGVAGDVEEIASARIGPAGGAIDTDFGVSIVVPAGAVDDEVVITATFDPVGSAYRFGPIGQVFDEAVLVTFAGDDGDLTVALSCFDEDFGACAAVPERFGSARPWAVSPAAPTTVELAPF